MLTLTVSKLNTNNKAWNRFTVDKKNLEPQDVGTQCSLTTQMSIEIETYRRTGIGTIRESDVRHIDYSEIETIPNNAIQYRI